MTGTIRRLTVCACVAVGVFLLLTACAQQSDSATKSPKKFTIVCTVGMVADIVRQVVGEYGDVSNIIGEGVDPHLYKTTRNDITKLDGADIVFYSGLMLEGKMADALVKVARRGKPVYAVTELIDETYLLEPEGLAGHHDPHVWMDVAGWMKGVEAVAISLAEVDPDNGSYYRENALAYIEELKELHEYILAGVASIPEEQRVLITAHDAFNYFGRAYDIEVLGIQGISTESEAGLDDINRLVDMIVSRGIKAVFVETSVADRNVRALVEGATSRGRNIVIGGSLFSDAMGAPGTYEGTYIGMLDHNATLITRALGGNAPERGMHEKLTGAKDH